jgi:hypothetical protein
MDFNATPASHILLWPARSMSDTIQPGRRSAKRFTQELLEILRSPTLKETTYRDIIQLLPDQYVI